MRKTILKISLVLLSVLVLSSCTKQEICDCFERTGTITTETRNISGFDKILVEDNLNVFITQDTIFEVKVESGNNLIPLIKTEVSDNTLTIRNKNRCNWTRSYDKPFNVYVKIPVINFITSDGTGTIKSTNTITTPKFDVQTKNSGDIELTVNSAEIDTHMHGSGDVILHGFTQSHFCDIGGTAFLRCQDLGTSYTYLHTYTTGESYVSTSGSLDCKIDKIGDVYCYGNPSIVHKVQIGSGQLFIK